MTKKKQNNKVRAYSTIIAALMLIGISLYWIIQETPPDPKTATEQEKLDFLSSDKFVKMSNKKQLNYLDQMLPNNNAPLMPLMLNNNIPMDQRENLMKNVLPVITPRIKQRLDEYDRMTPEQQIVQLDMIIDGFLQNQTYPGQNISPQRMALALQYMDPYLRSQLRKHIPDLVSRMSERGILPKNDLFDNLTKPNKQLFTASYSK